jgi:type II secretory pathway component PulJ
MGMAGSAGMNGHMQQYQHLQHSVSPQPTLGTSSPQTQNVPAPPPSVDGANVSRAQVSFLINGLQEDSWERQLGEIRDVSPR